MIVWTATDVQGSHSEYYQYQGVSCTFRKTCDNMLTRFFDSSITQSYINGGLTIWSWLVSLTAAFFVDRIGRRVLFLFAGIGMLLSFSVWTACSAVYAQTESSSAGIAVVAMIFVFYGT